jgi:hypothetical protein
LVLLQNGKLVDPLDLHAVGAAITDIILNKEQWNKFSNNGVKNILAYSWPSHCIKYLDQLEKRIQVEDPQPRHILQRRSSSQHNFDAVGAALYDHSDLIIAGDMWRVRSNTSSCVFDIL